MSAVPGADDFDHGPFDPDELVRWAETYGDPEQWCKKAQQLHAENERLREASQLQLTADEIYWLEGAAHRASQDKISKGLGTSGALGALAEKLRVELARREESTPQP